MVFGLSKKLPFFYIVYVDVDVVCGGASDDEKAWIGCDSVLVWFGPEITPDTDVCTDAGTTVSRSMNRAWANKAG